MEKLPFKVLHASVRPARIAILVDRTDQDWQDTCLRIIEFYSQLWGGAYNIIVPTDGVEIDERFWTLLETFDPDYVYRYQKSFQDLFQSHPDQYSKILEKQVDSFVSHSSSADRDATRAEIDKQLRNTWLSGFEVTRNLQREIKTRLAPFWFQEWVVDAGPITAGSPPSFPFTDITKMIGATEHPDCVAAFDVATGLLPPLWFSAVAGLLSAPTKKAWEECGISSQRETYRDENIDQLVEFVVTGETRGPRVLRPGNTVPNDVTPYSLTMLELGLYRSVRYEWWQEPMVAVAGNAFEDFCLFYCLARLRDRVVWVLPSITDKALGNDENAKLSSAETSFLFQLRRRETAHNFVGGLACVSCSLDSGRIDKVIQQLNRLGLDQFRNQVKKIEDLEPLVRFPLSVVERENFQRDISLQFSDDRSIGLFSTPKLKHFRSIDPYEQRYITQLSVVGDAPPKHFELGTTTIVDPRLTTKEARVGKEGPAYFCPNTAYFGGDIDTVLVRPRLHLPPLYKIVEQLARTEGYECRPSDKGIYADESITKWGGLEKISGFLRSTRHRALLDLFLDDSKSQAGKGVYLSDRRRYLDFVAVKMTVGDTATSLIDELVSQQIFYRGFIFGCSYCRNADWFAVGDITQEFKCRRCGRSQVYTKRNWKEPDEPAWFYKLDELIYQGYRQGMAVSLLALAHLKAKSQGSFTFATDREFWKPDAPKPDMEVDFFCAPDGVFTVGEAKTQDSLGRGMSEENARINKYRHLISQLSIRQLILATLSNSWRRETVEAVRGTFSDQRLVRVVFLNASQLL